MDIINRALIGLEKVSMILHTTGNSFGRRIQMLYISFTFLWYVSGITLWILSTGSHMLMVAVCHKAPLLPLWSLLLLILQLARTSVLLLKTKKLGSSVVMELVVWSALTRLPLGLTSSTTYCQFMLHQLSVWRLALDGLLIGSVTSMLIIWETRRSQKISESFHQVSTKRVGNNAARSRLSIQVKGQARPPDFDNDQDMKFYLNASTNICKILQEGMENPKEYVTMLNGMFSMQGLPSIVVTKSQLLLSKKVFQRKSTLGDQSSNIPLHASQPSSMLSPSTTLPSTTPLQSHTRAKKKR